MVSIRSPAMKRLGVARHLVGVRRAAWGGGWGMAFSTSVALLVGGCEPNCVRVGVGGGGRLQLVALGWGWGNLPAASPAVTLLQALCLVSVPPTPRTSFVLPSAVIFPRTSTQLVPSGLSQLSLRDSWWGARIRGQGVRLRHARMQLYLKLYFKS